MEIEKQNKSKSKKKKNPNKGNHLKKVNHKSKDKGQISQLNDFKK
jgi:hypothetical protein